MSFSTKNAPLIRCAVPDDAEFVRRFQAQSWRQIYPNEEHHVPKEWVEQITTDWLTPQQLTASHDFFVKFLADNNQFYRLAVHNNAVVGFVHGIKHRSNGTGHLAGLYIDKAHYGTGLSHRLMNELDSFFITNKIQKIDLKVAKYNQRAIGFYQKYNFKIIPNSETLLYNVIPSIKMIRDIR
jgi:ribosomal protein S18 acetylase RimI-like enzyme